MHVCVISLHACLCVCVCLHVDHPTCVCMYTHIRTHKQMQPALYAATHVNAPAAVAARLLPLHPGQRSPPSAHLQGRVGSKAPSPAATDAEREHGRGKGVGFKTEPCRSWIVEPIGLCLCTCRCLLLLHKCCNASTIMTASNFSRDCLSSSSRSRMLNILHVGVININKLFSSFCFFIAPFLLFHLEQKLGPTIV